MFQDLKMRPTLTICLIFLLFAAGCGKRRANQGAVGGAVELDGNPLMQGSILFAPIEGARGTITGGKIENGHYQLSDAASVSVGWNRVEIRAMRKTGRMVPKPFARHGEMIDDQTEAIPKQFNSESTLKVEVKPGDNVADFRVTSR
jgi:hypothetical protein